MINEQFLSSAVIIRKKYLNLNSSLSEYREKISGVQKDLEKISEDLSKINDYTEEKLKKMISFFDLLELEAEKLLSIVEPLNNELEQLSKDEFILYENMCKKYPNLTEQEIIDEVHERLKLENLL